MRARVDRFEKDLVVEVEVCQRAWVLVMVLQQDAVDVAEVQVVEGMVLRSQRIHRCARTPAAGMDRRRDSLGMAVGRCGTVIDSPIRCCVAQGEYSQWGLEASKSCCQMSSCQAEAPALTVDPKVYACKGPMRYWESQSCH